MDVQTRVEFYTVLTTMRTTIEIDDDLLAEAIDVTGAKTKREAVELGLAALVKLKRQERIRGYRGKLNWDDDLERMRTDQGSSSIRVSG